MFDEKAYHREWIKLHPESVRLNHQRYFAQIGREEYNRRNKEAYHRRRRLFKETHLKYPHPNTKPVRIPSWLFNRDWSPYRFDKKKYERRYRAENREKLHEMKHRNYLNRKGRNREEFLKRQKENEKRYRERHREELKLRERESRRKNWLKYRAHQYKWRSKNMAKFVEHMKYYNRKVKARLVGKKGGRCEICGYDKCIGAMEFHHKNPEEKEGMFDYRKLNFNLAKVQLICSNCHREIHFNNPALKKPRSKRFKRSVQVPQRIIVPVVVK